MGCIATDKFTTGNSPGTIDNQHRVDHAILPTPISERAPPTRRQPGALLLSSL